MVNRSASCLISGDDISEENILREIKAASAKLEGPASIGVVFVSGEWAAQIEDILDLVRVYGRCVKLVGCRAEGLIGPSVEQEEISGISVLLLSLPESRVEIFEITSEMVESEEALDPWRAKFGESGAALLLANPFSFPVDLWLHQWNEKFPSVPCVGGLSSGGSSGQELQLYHNGDSTNADALLIGIQGGVRVETLVSQGCEPIGAALPITEAQQNIIFSLGGRPAYEILGEAFQKLNEETRALAQGNLFAGIAFSEYRDEFKRGDFLIRSILGADPNNGAIAIGAIPRVGQTMQFQLRDKIAADHDLRRSLKLMKTQGIKPFASLLFCCNGRGESLFQTPDHDAKTVSEFLGMHPSAGFFCNGEIGPIGGVHFLHSYTVSIAIFCDAAEH